MATDILGSRPSDEDLEYIEDLINSDVDLLDCIIAEIGRIFGLHGLNGTFEEYAWLEQHYGVTQYDDVIWIDVLDYFASGEAPEEDDLESIDELRGAMFSDEGNIIEFMGRLLMKYRSNTIVNHRSHASYEQGETLIPLEAHTLLHLAGEEN